MQRKYVPLWHVLVWLLLTLSHTVTNYNSHLFSSYHQEQPGLVLFTKYLLIETGYTLIAAVSFYSSYLLVASQLFTRKNYGRALLYSAISAAIIVSVRYVIEYGFFLPVLHFDNYRGNVWPAGRYISNALFYYLPGYFMYGFIAFLAEAWYRNNQQQQELAKEKLNAELAYLRAQVNPHFLFNTINDIYSLSYQKSNQAPEALLKLSEILRYMLREGQQDFMPLSSEVAYLNNVIELQRISAKGMAYIDFETSGHIGNQPVAALIFIAFAENAFKHGVLSSPAQPVRIQLQATTQQVRFTIVNQKHHYGTDKSGGIGLNNIKRRLELIYPNRHLLNINDNEHEYSVELILDL